MQITNFFTYLWNTFIKKLDIPNPRNIVTTVLKNKLKNYLLSNQQSGNVQEWIPCNTNTP